MYTYVYVYVYVCICVCIYIYIYYRVSLLRVLESKQKSGPWCFYRARAAGGRKGSKGD